MATKLEINTLVKSKALPMATPETFESVEPQTIFDVKYSGYRGYDNDNALVTLELGGVCTVRTIMNRIDVATLKSGERAEGTFVGIKTAESTGNKYVAFSVEFL